jgi:hypothetical protein
MAAEQRQRAAHGVSRGLGFVDSEPRSGERKAVWKAEFYRPFRDLLFFLQGSHGFRRRLLSSATPWLASGFISAGKLLAVRQVRHNAATVCCHMTGGLSREITPRLERALRQLPLVAPGSVKTPI